MSLITVLYAVAGILGFMAYVRIGDGFARLAAYVCRDVIWHRKRPRGWRALRWLCFPYKSAYGTSIWYDYPCNDEKDAEAFRIGVTLLWPLWLATNLATMACVLTLWVFVTSVFALSSVFGIILDVATGRRRPHPYMSDLGAYWSRAIDPRTVHEAKHDARSAEDEAVRTMHQPPPPESASAKTERLRDAVARLDAERAEKVAELQALESDPETRKALFAESGGRPVA